MIICGNKHLLKISKRLLIDLINSCLLIHCPTNYPPFIYYLNSHYCLFILLARISKNRQCCVNINYLVIIRIIIARISHY